MPINVLMAEAVQVAGVLAEYWKARVEPRTKKTLRPGLESLRRPASKNKPEGATTGVELTPTLQDDILSLQRATQQAHASFLLASRGVEANDSVERGQFILSELKHTLEELVDDGVDNEDDEALARVAREHADDGSSAAELAQSLDDYQALAARHRDDMDGLGGFDAALIDEASEVATALRQPRDPATRESSEEAKAARLLRDRLATLLQQRIGRVRRAGAFVFRHHPEIARLVTSNYQRRRRAEARRKKAQEQGERISSVGKQATSYLH